MHSNRSYLLKKLDGTVFASSVHKNRLKPFFLRDDAPMDQEDMCIGIEPDLEDLTALTNQSTPEEKEIE